MLQFDYKILFSVAFKHEYFKNRVTNDLLCTPTEETAKVIRRHQLIYKVVDGGIQIIQRSKAGDANPLLSIANGTQFTFTLKIQSPQFLNHTNLSKAPGACLYFIEDGNKEAMKIDSIPWRKQKFEFTFYKKSMTNANVNVYNGTGQKLYTIPTKAVGGTIKVPIDLSALPAAPYRIQVVAKSKEAYSETFFANEDLRLSETYGIIHITKPFVSPLSINFPTLSSAWKYYVIPKKELTTFDLEIEDKQADDESGRYAGLEYSFAERPNDKSSTLPLAHLFESGAMDNQQKFQQTEIPFYEDPFTQLRLVKIDKQTSQRFVLIKNLPKPTVHQLKPEVFIYI